MNAPLIDGNKETSSRPSATADYSVEILEGIPLVDATWRRKHRLREQVGKSGDHRTSSDQPAASDIAANRSPLFQTSNVPAQEATPVPDVAGPPAEAEENAVSSHAPGLSGPELEAFLVNFVVEQTGYPSEIVEMDADLEADLGIDSIKKAQLFGELREHFDINPSADLSLDDFPTLGHVRDYLQSLTGGATSSTPTSIPTETAPSCAGDSVHARTSMERTSSPAIEPGHPSGNGVAVVVSMAAVSDVAPKSQVEVQNGTLRNEAPARVPSAEPVGVELEAFLVNFVVEQTGYPPEIVEMDADLEADLGIDSIKKAQLFGELREHFDINPSADLSLDDFPSLAHVRDYLQHQTRQAAGASSDNGRGTPHLPVGETSVNALAEASPNLSAEFEKVSDSSAIDRKTESGLRRQELESFLINFVVEQTGYPPEIVELEADLEADLGIDSIKKAQLFGELREHFDITPSADLSLDDFPTLADVRDYLLNASA